LTVPAELDENEYPTGVMVSDDTTRGPNITPSARHGDRNYSIGSVEK
jgi:hypothetical protein